MRMLLKTSLILMSLSTLSLSLYGVLAQSSADQVVLRDGQEITGRVNFLDEMSVQVNGQTIERTKVRLIRFAGATNNLPEEGTDTDLLIRRDNSRSKGYVARITDQLVIQNETEIKRADVALIRFAESIHTVSARPDESPSPSPTASPTPTPAGSAPGRESPSEEGKSNSKQGSDKESSNDPPWFGAGKDCKFSQRTYVFAGTVNWPQRNETDCYLYIRVCSIEIRRNTVNPLGFKCPEGKDFAQPTLCCDLFDKATKTGLCDPRTDADCDGMPNDLDSDPLNPKKK